MFFFSKKLIDDSLKSKKARAERMRLGHWGMDIPLWAEEKSSANSPEPVFISSGKEMRDMETLVKAFNATGARLDIYINERNGNIDYGGILRNLNMGENINVYFQIRLAPYEISRKVALSDCVCICCQPTKYTVGLTTLVEALSLGKPIICSRNPQFPFSVDHEGCGISVAYHDVEGWTNAVNYIKNHPEEAKNMGRKAKRLALTRYNDSICAQEAARAIIETANKKKRACNN